jgi:hypothetical protein
MELLRERLIERREVRSRVKASPFVENVTATEAIFGRNGPVRACREDIEVAVVRGRDEIVPERNILAIR